MRDEMIGEGIAEKLNRVEDPTGRSAEQAPAGQWRIGGKIPLNVYEGDKPMFQCHTPEDAARVVALLNEGYRLQNVEKIAMHQTEVAVDFCTERDELRSQLAEAELLRQRADESRVWHYEKAEEARAQLSTTREIVRALIEALERIHEIRLADEEQICTCQECSQCIARTALTKARAAGPLDDRSAEASST